MKVKLFCLFVIQLILLAMVTTNPNVERHKEFASVELLKDFQKPTPYVKELVSVVVEEKIYREDYWLFSITKFDDLGSMKTLGVGIFDRVLPIESIVENKPLIILSIIGFFTLLGFISKKLNF